MSIFWETALAIMEEKGVKQADLARLTGKNKSSVSDWVKHDVLPKADDAVKIATLLGVSVEYLVTGSRPEAELTEKERQLLDLCQGLSDQRMDVVISVVKDMKAGWLKE